MRCRRCCGEQWLLHARLELTHTSAERIVGQKSVFYELGGSSSRTAGWRFIGLPIKARRVLVFWATEAHASTRTSAAFQHLPEPFLIRPDRLLPIASASDPLQTRSRWICPSVNVISRRINVDGVSSLSGSVTLGLTQWFVGRQGAQTSV